MDGDIAPLPDLVEVAERHGAIMMIDDAHAVRVLGKNGKGTVSHFGLDPLRVDIQVGTLSKAIGVLGGFIAGPQHLIEWLVNRGRPFLFSTSATPAVTAACIAALDVLESEPERVERLWDERRLLQAGSRRRSGSTPAPARRRSRRSSPARTAPRRTCRGCCSTKGCSPRRSCSPRWPKGRARVRTIVTSEHTEEDLRRRSTPSSAWAEAGADLMSSSEPDAHTGSRSVDLPGSSMPWQRDGSRRGRSSASSLCC